MPSTDHFSSCLASNKSWADKCCREKPDLLPTLSQGQSPKILWLGCSDSRVPETTILGLQPGDVFVHRNIANIIHVGDLSSQAVIEYAVAHLKVQEVVLCGHSSCGGANAALGNTSLGVLDAWLMPLRELRMSLTKELAAVSEAERTAVLVKANVRAGVKRLRGYGVVQRAMKERGLKVHGVVYDLKSGLLEEVDTDEAEDVVGARREAFQLS